MNMYTENIKKEIISLGYAWVDSITFLWSDKVKLAVFGSYRALLSSYWIFLTKFWWLILIPIVVSHFMHNSTLHIGLIYLFGFIWSLVTVLTVRPSVAQKTYAYYMYFWYFVATMFVLFIVFYFLKPLLMINFMGFLTLAIGIHSPVFLCCAFFVADSVNDIKDILINISNGIKMVLYNYPLFLLVHMVWFALWNGIEFLATLFAATPLSFIFGSYYIYYICIILLSGYACIINSLYIQRRHEQRELYRER